MLADLKVRLYDRLLVVVANLQARRADWFLVVVADLEVRLRRSGLAPPRRFTSFRASVYIGKLDPAPLVGVTRAPKPA